MGSYPLIATIPAKAGIHPWDAGEAPAPFPPLGTRFRGHDDAPTVIPAPEQESIPGTRGRPRPIPPSGYPLPRARRRPNRHSCPRAGIHPWDAGEAPPHSSLWVPASAGTTTPQPSFLPPSRNPSLGRGGGPAPSPLWMPAFAGMPTGRARRGPLTWVRGPLSSVGVAAVGLCRGGSRTAPTLGYMCRRQSLAVRLLRCGAASVPRLPPHPRLSVSGWLSAISGTRRRLRQPA